MNLAYNLEESLTEGIAFPIRGFLVEMLSKIFVHTLPKSPFLLSNNHAPLLLERV